MSFYYSSNSLEDIHSTLMETLLGDFDYESAPRGKPIRELIAPTFTLTNPRNRIITSPARAVNYGFAVGELCWYLRGDDDLATMLYYNKRMSQFSDDGETINSAYGHRIFKDRWYKGSDGSRSQFDNAIAELACDPHSRRAIIHINEPGDLFRAVENGSKDVPCTLSLQLFIRKGLLHMHGTMRSNDVVWGLPYDVFSFTCLMELFLEHLQVAGVPVDGLGHYHHTAGSLHLYDTHFAMAGDVAKEFQRIPAPMKPFTLAQMEDLAYEVEPIIRQKWDGEGRIGADDGPIRESEESFEWMTRQLRLHKLKRIAEYTRMMAAYDVLELRSTEEAVPEQIEDDETVVHDISELEEGKR